MVCKNCQLGWQFFIAIFFDKLTKLIEEVSLCLSHLAATRQSSPSFRAVWELDSLSRLAGAVAKCGGVGTISGVHPGYREPEFAKDPFRTNLQAIGRELSRARQIAPEGVIGFNFMSVMNHYDAYVREAIAQGADFIVSGAGLPTGLAKLAQGTKTAILPIVSSARALRLIVKSWLRADKLPDAVVVEGPLAGGHLGFKYDDMYLEIFQA